MNSPDIFQYSDYRKFLKAWLDFARKEKRMNLSRLAEAISVHTSFLAHVLGGAKSLSFEQASELGDVLELTPIERDYFFAMLQIDRAGTPKLKKYWLEKKQLLEKDRLKLNSRVGTHHELSAEDRAVFYSSWLYVAVYVAVSIDDGQTLEQIAERFRLSRDKAQEILSFLVQTGVCDKSESLYVTGKSVVYLSNASPLVVKHHANWRLRAIQKMDSREQTELFFTSPMSLGKKDFVRVRELFAKAIEEALEICRHSTPDEVVCLNVDFFRSVS